MGASTSAHHYQLPNSPLVLCKCIDRICRLIDPPFYPFIRTKIAEQHSNGVLYFTCRSSASQAPGHTTVRKTRSPISSFTNPSQNRSRQSPRQLLAIIRHGRSCHCPSQRHPMMGSSSCHSGPQPIAKCARMPIASNKVHCQSQHNDPRFVPTGIHNVAQR